MPLLNDWVNKKFEEIACKLPTLVHTEPASFSCGFNTGYNQALLDLEIFLDKQEDCDHVSDGLTYMSNPPQNKCKKCSEFYR